MRAPKQRLKAGPRCSATGDQIETYISERTSAAFSHGICPYCKDECFRPGDREPEA